MSFISVGYDIQARGLVEANKQIDSLLAKVASLSGQRVTPSFNLGSSISRQTAGINSVTKAMEKQRIMYDYMLGGMQKGTASTLASFSLLGASIKDINTYTKQLANNKALDEQRKAAEKLAREQQKAQEARNKANQKAYLESLDLMEKKRLAEEKALQSRNKALQAQYYKNLALIEEERKAKEKAVQRTNAQIQREYLKNMQRLDNERKKAVAVEESKQKAIQRSIDINSATQTFKQQGFTQTNARQLATLQVSGASASQMNDQRRALEALQGGLRTYGDQADSTSRRQASLNQQIMGIAKYAVLSAVIYGLMTATVSLGAATVRLADEYTAIQNRMSLYIKDGEKLKQVNEQLVLNSMENNVGLRESATLYARLAPAMQKLGANTAAINTVVDSFGKSMRIGGATAQEAAAATIQFSQAMASGKLQGDEFRSISEASPRFLKAIADGSGIATESLKKFSSEGLLTTSLIARALIKEYPKLIEENKALGVTLEQGVNAIQTGFMSAIGELNAGAGVTQAIGEMFMDSALSLAKFAQTARQTGENIKNTWNEWLPVINTVTSVLEGLVVFFASRYVASLVVASATTGVFGTALTLLGVKAGASAAWFSVATRAVFSFGAAVQTALGFLTSWTGVLTVIGGVAAYYGLFKDSAAQANEKLAEQSKLLDITAEAWKKYTNEQKENAKVKLQLDIEEANKNIEKALGKFEGGVLNVATNPYLSNEATKEALKIYQDLENRVISLDTAMNRLSKVKGVDPSQIQDVSKLADEYATAAKVGLEYGKAAKVMGLNTQVAGNQLQNATPQLRGMTEAALDAADAFLQAADAMGSLGRSFQTQAKEIETKLFIKQQGFEGNLANDIYKEAAKLVESDAGVIKAQQDFNDELKRRQDLAGDNAKMLAELSNYAKEEQKKIDLLKQNTLTSLLPSVMRLAQPVRDAQDKEAAWQESQREQKRLSRKTARDVNNFPEQLSQLERQVNLLKQGNSAEVARVASAKDYFKWYGENLVAAKQMVALQTQISDLEKAANIERQKQDAKDNAENENNAIKLAILLAEKGFSVEVARQVAQAKMLDDAEGIAYATKLTENSIASQTVDLYVARNTMQDVLEFQRQGYSLSVAQDKVKQKELETISKTAYQNQLMQQSLKEVNAIYTRRQNILEDIYQTTLAYTAFGALQNNELAELETNNKGVSKTDLERLINARKIVDYLKAQNDALNDQKSLTYDLSQIDFSVFGSFSDPFQQALNSLNLMIFGVKDLNTEYDKMLDFNAAQGELINKQIKQQDEILASVEKESNAYGVAEQTKQNLIKEGIGIRDTAAKLEMSRQRELDEIQHKSILSGLALTKAFFKENSKGYKAMTALERTYQAGVVAFSLWKKKDEITQFALEMKNMAMSSAAYIADTGAKIAAEMGLNAVKGIGAILTQGSGDPYTAFARMAAMAVAVAALGVTVANAFGGGGSGSYDGWQNEGKGTVFGMADDGSESISKSLELLRDNSDLLLPINSAMLQSIRNIENNIAGVANLAIRGETGGIANTVNTFSDQFTGVGKVVKDFATSSITTIAVAALSAFKGAAAVSATLGAFGIAATVAGQALGAALTGGLSLLLGFITAPLMDKLMGGLFGKTTQSVTATGLALNDQTLGDLVNNGANLQEYADIETKKKSWFKKSTSYSTVYGKAGDEISNQFTLIFKDIYSSVSSAAMVLGKDLKEVEKLLNSYVVNLGKIQLSGLTGEELQEKLSNVFGAAADNIAKAAVKGLDDFQKVGEGYYETLVRVAQAITTAEYYVEGFGYALIDYNDIVNKQGDVTTELVRQSVLLGDKSLKVSGGFHDLVGAFDGAAEELVSFINTLRDLQEQMYVTGKDSAYLTAAMITAAGGESKLASGLDAYFEMLSPTEQAQELTRRLAKDFDILGQKLPENSQGFRDLVKSIDVTTEAGQKLYGRIIALAPEFNELQDALESARSETNALVESLRDLAEQARLARGDTEQTRSLSSTRFLFDQATQLALGGDQEAAKRMVELGKTLLTQSKSYSTTYQEYLADLVNVQKYATNAADLFDGTSSNSSVGTITTPPVTPPSSTNTSNNTSNNSNASVLTNQKLDELKKDLIDALYAIAKTNQNMSDRLERWDYGDSISVHVDQDGTNDPIPVRVV